MSTGLAAEIEKTAASEPHSTEEVLAQQRKLRELDHKLDEYVENAVRYQDILKTSVKLDEHVRIIFGYEEELALLNGTPDEVHARREAITREIEALCARYATMKLYRLPSGTSPNCAVKSA